LSFTALIIVRYSLHRL